MDGYLFSQYLLSGLVIGIIYSLMALGITFIYGIMKMINWAMGEFYMIGSYVQYALLATVLGPGRWWVALPLAMASVFVLGVVTQRVLLRPMYVRGIERRAAKRHPSQISDSRYPPIKRALRRLARQDHLPRLSTRKGRLLRVQAQVVHLHRRTVAGVTVLFEDRLNFLRKANLSRGGNVLFRRPLWLR